MRRLATAVLASLALVGAGGTAQAQTTPPAPVCGTPHGQIDGAQVGCTSSSGFGISGSSIHIDAVGLGQIEVNENVSRSRYCPEPDPVLGWAVPTRAFGETEGIRIGSACISHAQAEANLKRLVEARYQWAVRGLGMNLNQCQVNALDDFVWNLGAGIFSGSLRGEIQHRQWSAILAYDHAGGAVIAGLFTRRHLEYRWLTEPCHDNPLTPAQIRAERLKQLHADEGELRVLRGRLATLRRVMGTRHCSHRKHDATCKRWAHEGYVDHVKGYKLDGSVVALKRELGIKSARAATTGPKRHIRTARPAVPHAILVAYAEAVHLGHAHIPYVFGGDTLRGLDCSKAVSWDFRVAGLVHHLQGTWELEHWADRGVGRYMTLWVIDSISEHHTILEFDLPGHGRQFWAAQHTGTFVGFYRTSRAAVAGYNARHL